MSALLCLQGYCYLTLLIVIVHLSSFSLCSHIIQTSDDYNHCRAIVFIISMITYFCFSFILATSMESGYNKYLTYTLSPLNKISDYKIWDPFKKLIFYFIGN